MNDFWTRLDPGFLAPVWLVVGAVAVVAVLLLEIGAERRRRQALRLFAAPHLAAALTASVSPQKRFWKRFLFVAALAFLFIALARPHLFFRWQEESRTGVDLLVAVDCSKSMLTEDVKPNRLGRAKLAIADFADRLPNDRLGLIAFAGDAFLQVPLTLDHDAFLTAVQELDTDTIPRPGTDLATAIDQAVQALRSQAANAKILILVTDGEDLENHAIESAKNAAQAGLKIYTVGVGTPEGDLIPERDDSGALMYLHDSSGQIVKSRLDENTLRQVASVTGGAYAPLGQRGEGLDEIYQRYVASLPKHQLESRREKIPYERYEWPLTTSILLLIASMLMNERAPEAPRPAGTASAPLAPRRRRQPLAAASAVLLTATLVCPSGRAATTDKAERDYKSGRYPEAVQNYKTAAQTQPDRDDIKYDLGAAAYKAGEYSQAEEAFRNSLATPDLGLQEKAYYNLGNTQFRHGETMQKDDGKKTIDLWQKALKSYESSLKLKPSADAQHNYEYVKRKLEQLKQQQQRQNQGDPSSSKPSDQPDKSGDGQGDKSDASKSQNPSPSPNNGKPQDSSGENQARPNANGDRPDAGKQGQEKKEEPTNGHSTSRVQDEADPGAKSQRDAEALLDSLKDDEKHVSSRSLNGNNEPPPPASGKDW